MTAYALRLENATDTAARVRLGDLFGLAPAGPLTAVSGIRPVPTSADVDVVDGTMQVTVEPFIAWVQGGISTAQGGYSFVLDAQATLTLSNGDPSLDRTDTIAVVIHDDPFDGSGLVDAAVVVVEGTPGSGAPTLPDNCLPLRDIDVPAGTSTGTGGLTASELGADRRTYASGLGGVVAVTSQAQRDALPAQNGTLVYRHDLDRLEIRRSTGWQTVTTEDGALTTTGGFNLAGTSSGSPATLDLSVPAGSWLILAKGYFNFSTSTGIANTVTLHNNTGGVELEYTAINLPGITSSLIPFALHAPVTLAVASTIQFRAWTDGGGGTQLITSIRLTAIRASR